MRYLNRIFFINSANVKYAEIAIDGNVHFIGTQGVGKSTLLRAILFFYNGDTLKLGIEKGKKIFADYYFPGADSYIVYEVMRDTGPYCIMAFKSQGRPAFRFINSAYQLGHYVDEGRVRSWDSMRDNFGRKVTYTKKIDRYEEYRDILYGNNTGLEKEFRKYSLIESRQYQNLPRTIQNVFLNSKLDAEFIKQTIIMSLNEEEVKIDLDKYSLHLKDFDTQLADINKWTETNKAGEIPVRKMAEQIARIHSAIQSLNREKKETAIQMFHGWEAAKNELPIVERKRSAQQALLQVAYTRAEDLQGKFQAKRDEVQKQISILENDIKKAKTRSEYYDTIDIASIIQRVARKELNETERERLASERTLLSARFTEINSRFEALMQQQQNAFSTFENSHLLKKNKLNEGLLAFKDEVNEQYNLAFAEIRKQHQDELEVARNVISGKKDTINELKLKKQRTQLQPYFEKELETTKNEITDFQQKIKNNSIDIADYKNQVEALQKRWELDTELNEATFEKKIEKLREEIKVYTASITSIDAKLESSKDSLYGWLNSNMPGWEKTIGKVIDEEHILFQAGLSPQLVDTTDSVYGLKIDLQEISRKVKTVAEYEKDRTTWQSKADTTRANINKLTEQKNDAADKLKTKYSGKIKELNNARRQLEYELVRAKGQLQANEVKLADYIRKAAEEKERLLEHVAREIEAASEALLAEEKNLSAIENGIEKQLDNKEKERNRKLKAEELRIKEIGESYEQELNKRRQETSDRIEDIKQQQNSDLRREGADVSRIADIERELVAINRELDFINDNRDKVAEYNKDRRELLDHVDAFKTEKRLKTSQLENEQEKYNLQKQKITQEIDQLTGEIKELNTALDTINEGLLAFDNFRQTDHYRQVAVFEGDNSEVPASGAELKALIDTLNGRIYTILERYNDLQSAINKFLGNFSAQNVFGFKTNLIEREEFIAFAEMLYEFLEEDKIVQYEKRVNERFATLIRQIGKETNELTSKGGEIQKVITEINRDFEERNFAGVIKSIKLQLTESQNKIVALLQEIKTFNDKNSMGLGVVDLFSTGDNEGQNKKAIGLLKEFAREINGKKEKEIGLPDSFELQFRIVENENDSGWVEKLTNVGSEGTDILVKAMINIMLLNVFKDSASKRFKEFRLHCMMDEIGKLHPNNVKGILKFANDRNILLINSSPTSYNATDYRYTYLLSKDAKHITTVKRLIKKGADE